MGWNWAMWFANRVHSHQALVGSELSLSRLVTDQTAPPDLQSGEPVLLPYYDNLNVAGCDAARVTRARDLAANRLRSLGFVVHEETGPVLHATSLGYEVDGETCVVRPGPERLAQVVAACRWLSRGPRVYGWQPAKLLGHIMLLSGGPSCPSYGRCMTLLFTSASSVPGCGARPAAKLGSSRCCCR